VRRSVVLAVVVAVVVVGAVLIHWQWHSAHAPEWAVAIGTLALAVATVYLGREAGAEGKRVAEQAEATRRSTDAVERQAAIAQEQVRVARQTLEASFRPVITNVSPETRDDWSGVNENLSFADGSDFNVPAEHRAFVATRDDTKLLHVAVPIRNGGTGIAFIAAASMRWKPDASVSGLLATTVLPAGERAWIRFSVPKVDVPEGSSVPVEHSDYTNLISYGSVSVLVRYDDLGGNGWVTRLDIHRRPGSGRWDISQVFVKAANADDAEAVGSGRMYPGTGPAAFNWRPV
jgi:hypothetical protein